MSQSNSDYLPGMAGIKRRIEQHRRRTTVPPRRPFIVLDDEPGTWWLMMQSGNNIGRVRATGRRKALRVVQKHYGGLQHGTGGFYDVLVGSELGTSVRVVKTLDELEGTSVKR